MALPGTASSSSADGRVATPPHDPPSLPALGDLLTIAQGQSPARWPIQTSSGDPLAASEASSTVIRSPPRPPPGRCRPLAPRSGHRCPLIGDPLAATPLRIAAAHWLHASLPPRRSARLFGPLLPSILAIRSPFRAVRCQCLRVATTACPIHHLPITPIGPILTLSLPSLRLFTSLLPWLELGPPVARESGGDAVSVVPRSSRSARPIPLLSALPEYSVNRLGSIVVSEKDTFTQADAGFLHLQRFSVQKHPNTTRFYRLFDSPGLRYLDASFFQADDYRDILGCCTAWARRFPSLENLKLYVTLKGDAAHHPRPYSSIIEPLFQLHSLRYVDLEASCGQFVPNDADIEAVAHSWSELIHFCANDLNDYDSPQSRMEQESQTDSCIGPSALVLLASRCLLLLLLQIPRVKINLANIDALSNFPVLNHRLHTLSVGSMHSDDCSLTALFIDRLFPHIQILGIVTWSDSTWGRVKHHVKVCQTARRQQAQRLASSAPVTTDV